MNAPRDNRIHILALTFVLISGMGILIQQLNNSNSATTNAGKPLDTTHHAIQQKHTEIDKRFEQAVLMLHAQQYDYAVTALHRVLELAPTLPEAHVNMGFALLGQGNNKAAQDFFQSALALRSTQTNAYWGLAVSLEALCDTKGAIGAMRTYLHLAKPDARFVTRARSALWEWETTAQGVKPMNCQS